MKYIGVQEEADEHYDDYAIKQFSKMMCDKMAASRVKGRSGWNDPEKCSVDYLRTLLYEHLDKGDPVDVANFCMMLRHYEASTARTEPVADDVAALVYAAKSLHERCLSGEFYSDYDDDQQLLVNLRRAITKLEGGTVDAERDGRWSNGPLFT